MATTITGPVTGGARGWPFGATLADLDAVGYVEEEFFLSGDATRYRAIGDQGLDGRWQVEANGTAPFATRILVRRPTDPARFNGTVLVEWNNVTAGSEIFEAGDTAVVFDEGFAYVAVSAQRVGVHGFEADPHGLVVWDPERYGHLHVDDDGLSYGIFTEAARAVAPKRPTDGVDPLGGLDVRRLLGIGGSQSAMRLTTYIDAVQPLEHVFDGFVAFTAFGIVAALEESQDASATYTRPNAKAQIRTDLDVPVMVVNSECETLSYLPVRQPDTDLFRYWEVAGAPHGPRLHMERIVPKMQRDGLGAPGGGAFDASALSPVPWAPVLDAALAHVHRWIQDGPPPPIQPLIAVTGEPAHIERDADGNAIGGVRVPEMEAPLGRYTGAMEEAGTGGLMGAWEPLPEAVVKARYADRAAYVSAYSAAADAAVAAGVLRPVDAAAGVARAAAVDLP